MPKAATQICSPEFDSIFSRLPASIQDRIQAKLDALGQRLESYPHYKMTGVNAFRLRIGDYRVIYRVDIETNELLLVTLGHRREIYR